MVIIISTLEDATARAVIWALGRAGIPTYLLDLLNFPSGQTCSIFPRKVGALVETKTTGGEVFQFNTKDVRVVWNRRVDSKYFDLRGLHIDDVSEAHVEARALALNLYELINASPEVMPINSLASARAARSKLLQLQIAQKIGLAVPNTLVSNDFRVVKDFFYQNRGKVVFKPFYQHQWIEGNSVYFQWTSQLGPEHLDESVIGLSPGIYQSLVDKDYELRIMAVNDELMVVKLHTQGNYSTLIDSRGDMLGKMNVELVESIPSAVEEMLRALMSEMGLVCGCIDIIVTKSGEYVFLEVNERGQFLWTESLNQNIPALSTFCRQLGKMAGYGGIDSFPSFREFMESTQGGPERAKLDERETLYEELKSIYAKANIAVK